MSAILGDGQVAASGLGATFAINDRLRSGRFALKVTPDSGAAADDKLDVYIQSSSDGGTTWDDFVHFTQVAGNAAPGFTMANWVRDILPTRPQGATQDAAMAAGVNQGPVGRLGRVKYVVTVGSGNHTFRLSVGAELNHR